MNGSVPFVAVLIRAALNDDPRRSTRGRSWLLVDSDVDILGVSTSMLAKLVVAVSAAAAARSPASVAPGGGVVGLEDSEMDCADAVSPSSSVSDAKLGRPGESRGEMFKS